MDYSYIIIPLLVVIGSQAIKLATDGIKGNFDIKEFFITYGGMPSSHTAFVVSVTMLVGLRQGFGSPLFAVAAVFALIVMRDAVSFRNILGNQAKAINKILGGAQPKLRERMGHSPLEVFAGAVWAIAITYFLNLL